MTRYALHDAAMLLLDGSPLFKVRGRARRPGRYRTLCETSPWVSQIVVNELIASGYLHAVWIPITDSLRAALTAIDATPGPLAITVLGYDLVRPVGAHIAALASEMDVRRREADLEQLALLGQRPPAGRE